MFDPADPCPFAAAEELSWWLRRRLLAMTDGRRRLAYPEPEQSVLERLGLVVRDGKWITATSFAANVADVVRHRWPELERRQSTADLMAQVGNDFYRGLATWPT